MPENSASGQLLYSSAFKKIKKKKSK
jgi:hypothetical protein